jgi:hypothetical protein
MRLSEAIRLGAMATGHATGTSLSNDGNTCALGAALVAIGKATRLYSNAFYYWPILNEQVFHPVTGECLCMLSAVRILNDDHRWTREQIADWVQTVESERQQADASPEAVHAVAGTVESGTVSSLRV